MEKQQNNLANINSQISEKQSDKARRECEENSAMQWVDGRCVPKTEQPVATNTPEPAKEYDGKIGDSCGEGKVWFVTFNNPTKKCLGMSGIVSCDCIPGERYDGTIGQPCTGDVEGSVWTKDGDKKCLVAEGSKESVACSCKKSSDAVAANPIPTPVVARDPNPAVVANPNPTPTETQPQAPSTPQTRDAKITGYCLNKEGDTGSLDESQKTLCWCDIYMVDYCAKSKLFDGQSGVCDLSTNAGAACQRFCESKKADFISFCDSLQ